VAQFIGKHLYFIESKAYFLFNEIKAVLRGILPYSLKDKEILLPVHRRA
jgi:hypothetical protein